ncbi:phosphate acyltransferase PlsX [Acidaminobacter sp. JC074]|uniref:phosphate acyltransferase PlsX n=1 Tax=Acidaminobacter sp. JC074 TaxID=2530199 RepID=UPI001F1052D3|nr:phosphate acyltransferase PlsX [Acidaminobacter sp. JC074]MCH4888345.1 phosphate acyltransferase PlsX [Acidaminobacter sp. JC074]
MRIAIDAMGGDHAPVETVKGAVEALKEISGTMVLLGNEDAIKAELAKYTYDESRIEIIPTTEVVENEDKPVIAIKRKKDSSMVVGFDKVRKGEIDALISAGNTGALLAGGLLRVGRIKGVDRPALTTVFPTFSGMFVMADVGANAECKARNLLEFGIMGSIYAKDVLGIDNPKVGLINIGTEEGKGTPVINEAYQLLKESDLNFIGNVEARDIPERKADVLVCDGFTGNVVLKLTEGVAKSFMGELKSIFLSNTLTKIAAGLVKGKLSDLKVKMDYTEYGGAPLLGVKAPIVKAHGSSNAKAFKNAIKYAEKYVSNNIIEKISSQVQTEDDE